MSNLRQIGVRSLAARDFSACLPRCWLSILRRVGLTPVLQSSANHPEADVPAASYRVLARIAVTKIYVGNLPFSATDASIRAPFGNHGAVEKVSLIDDRGCGRRRGFGFVEMASADAVLATQAPNGTDFEGRTLTVNEAQERSGEGFRSGPQGC